MQHCKFLFYIDSNPCKQHADRRSGSCLVFMMRPRRERSARPFSKWLLRRVFACLVTQDGDARGSWGQPAFIRPCVLFQVCCHLAFVRGWSRQFAAFVHQGARARCPQKCILGTKSGTRIDTEKRKRFRCQQHDSQSVLLISGSVFQYQNEDLLFARGAV